MLKSFRFKHEDVMRLSRLRKNLPARSDTEVIRMALELLESSSTRLASPESPQEPTQQRRRKL